MPDIVIILRENWKLSGRREAFVKIATHNSKAPTVSLTGVKVSTNPTKITEGMNVQTYYLTDFHKFITHHHHR